MQKRKWEGQVVVDREKLPPNEGPTVKKVAKAWVPEERKPVGKTLGAMMKEGHL